MIASGQRRSSLATTTPPPFTSRNPLAPRATLTTPPLPLRRVSSFGAVELESLFCVLSALSRSDRPVRVRPLSTVLGCSSTAHCSLNPHSSACATQRARRLSGAACSSPGSLRVALSVRRSSAGSGMSIVDSGRARVVSPLSDEERETETEERERVCRMQRGGRGS